MTTFPEVRVCLRVVVATDHPDDDVVSVRLRLVDPRVVRLLRRCADLPEQRTPEWFARRNTMITASDVASVLGVSKFQTRRVALRHKVGAILDRAELVRVWDDRSVAGGITAWGTQHEDAVRDRFCQLYDEVCHETGCVPHPKIAFLGASPDGVLESGALLEIKCPVRRIIDPNVVPPQYYHQIQLQLEVCDLDLCYYVEWAPREESFFDDDGVPKDTFSVQRVLRDPAWLTTHLPALRAFWNDVQGYVNDPERAVQDLAPRKRRKIATTTTASVRIEPPPLAFL